MQSLPRSVLVVASGGREHALVRALLGWISDCLLFTDDPDEVVAFYRKKLQVL